MSGTNPSTMAEGRERNSRVAAGGASSLPGKSAQQAVEQARQFVAQGRRWVVDIDLEKFFDRVNHDILMDRVERRVKDGRITRLIRRYLEAGVMENGQFVLPVCG